MINKVTLIGNLGGDPETRTLDNGTAVGRFSLATNESYKDKDGNFQTVTEWHNVVVWREQAERAEKSLKKGMLCYVEGKIKYRKYTGTDGVERTVTDIEAVTFRVLERKDGGANEAREAQMPTAEPQQRTTRQEPDYLEAPQNGNDLPF